MIIVCIGTMSNKALSGLHFGYVMGIFKMIHIFLHKNNSESVLWFPSGYSNRYNKMLNTIHINTTF